MSAFESAFRKQHTITRNNANGHAMNVGKAADQCAPVPRLKLIEAGAVHEACNDFANFVGRAQIRRDNPHEFVRVIGGLFRRKHLN
ncbi:hypothetical protein MnTg02_00325 [bacterium MnTg02]|nr:hypothetical protein MnTg02_00325 [bacterium MnTg02]